MVEDKGGLVHLAQDEQHLVIDELLEFFQAAVHLLLQLIADLWAGQSRRDAGAEHIKNILRTFKELCTSVQCCLKKG